MRKLVGSFMTICIAFILDVSEADSYEPPDFDVPTYTELSDECDWGCFYWGYMGNRNHNVVYSKGNFSGMPFLTFYLKNSGPRAITVMAVAPSWYTGWGCAASPLGRTCNRIRRLERGERIIMGMIYGDALKDVEYDFRFIDEDGFESQFDDVLLNFSRLEEHSIPRVTYRDGSLTVKAGRDSFEYFPR